MSHIRRLLSAALLFSAPWILFAENEERFSEAELDQMLAPIALYPDALLAQILTASTYPLEIVAAERWLQEHKNLEGDQAVEAAESKNWDPSVTALVAFPDILKRMNDDLEWTQRLGEAVLIQQEEVMASVQKLREKAYTAGNLRSHEEVEVRREKEIIYIESSNPRVVYVPYYNPTIVYGSWWWHSHPPVYWGPSTFVSIRTGSTRIVWSSGYRFSTHYFYSRPDWHRRHIVVHHHYHNRQKPNYVHRSRRDWDRYSSDNRWQHQPRHRRGARYQSTTARERFSHRNHPTETTRTARERPNSANPAIQNRAER
ncbi:MAG TPA: DUF3300 domain-containing protein, partial [Opitutales bacterium]|nr:DUF3300 domain-containing protein [Opitutales bacterium]